MGFPYIQLNTNGKRLAEDRPYVKALKEAGLSSVFMQFDGLSDHIYLKTRGQKLLRVKEQAINNCADEDLGVVLVMTVVPKVNDHQVGDIIKFAVERRPHVRGIHFQPVSYFGRFPAAGGRTGSSPSLFAYVESQTNQTIRRNPSFSCYRPSICSFTAISSFRRMAAHTPHRKTPGKHLLLFESLIPLSVQGLHRAEVVMGRCHSRNNGGTMFTIFPVGSTDSKYAEKQLQPNRHGFSGCLEPGSGTA